MRWDPLQRLFLVYQGGDDPPPQQSTTNVTQMYSPEEAARRAAVMGEAERIYQANKNMPQTVPGAMSPETRMAQDMMMRLAKGGSAVPDMAQQLQAAQTTGFNAMLNPTAAPGFQDVLGTSIRKVNEAYTGPTGPMAQIRNNFTAGNSGGSGTREGVAMGMAGRDYLNTIGDVTGKLTSDAYGKGMDLFAKTMAMAPTNIGVQQGAEMLPANIIGGIGAQNEAHQEAQQLWNINAPWMALAPYANTVTGFSNPSTQTTQTVPGARSNPMAPLGMAAMGASLGAPFGPMGAGVGAGAGLVLSLFK